MIDNKTIGQLIDELTVTNMRCWFAQEKLMDESLSEEERLYAAIQAQNSNSKRNKLIRAIDYRLGEEHTVDEKSYG